ncbi:MAG: 6,7-dimethyl-8-ribityllumazine synthase [Alphaproteobacteria bacterium]|nr:MAG: 6,7-dimethyl-8-ribityllumazine synthase [Alphaproteobacteria bacterium]
MATRPHVLLVEARFYGDLSDALAAGAARALERAGASYERVAVPGALEIPAAIAIAADSGRFDAFVALGCVIRGETTHYDTVANESARALQDLATSRRLAIGNGILTVENWQQGWVRANPDDKDKGGGAAAAALALAALKMQFEGR